MKNELKEEFKRNILLSQFDLSEQDLSLDWFNGFFTNPISKSLNILDKENNWMKKDLYIGFFELEEPSEKKKEKDFYVELNRKIKQKVLDEWGANSKQKPVYKRFRVKSNNKGFDRYICIYISPKRENKIFDYDAFFNKEEPVSAIFDMLMNAYFLEKINKRNIINMDICMGKIFLNPCVSKEKDSVMVYEFSFKMEDFKLRFLLKHQVYKLGGSGINLFDDVCSAGNLKYEDKLDAREYTRMFLTYENYEKIKESKFFTQLELYKDVTNMLNSFEINYKTTTFKPEYMFTQFAEIKNKVAEINVYVSTEHRVAYENSLNNRSIPHDFMKIVEYLEKMKLKVNFIQDPDFNLILKNKNIPSLYIMFGKRDDKQVSFVNEKGETKKLSDVLTPFLGDRLYELNYEDFLSKINVFDVYSQVKFYNLYANANGFPPVISQGLVLGVSNVFEKSTIPPKNPPKKPVPCPSKSTVSIFNKIISELEIKKKIYSDREFSFKTKFKDFDNIDISDVKIINKLPNKKGIVYSYVELKKISNNDLFKIQKSKLFVNEQINSLNLEVNWKQEFTISDSLIIINDAYLIKVRDNDLMPFLIMDESKINVSGKDISFDVEFHIQAGNSANEKPKKYNKIDSNFYYPFNLPVIKTMVIENYIKTTSSKGYSNCMFNVKGNEINAFMTLNDSQIKNDISKNNRLESISLFKYKDFVYKKANWCENEQVMYFYLSSLTFNCLSINGIAKKSLLAKIGDVILVN